MRDVANIEAIATLPIDYLGFIFYEKSPRFVLNNDVFETACIPEHIQRVAVTVNEHLDFIMHLHDDFGFRVFLADDFPTNVSVVGIIPPESCHGIKLFSEFPVFSLTKLLYHLCGVFLFHCFCQLHSEFLKAVVRCHFGRC